MVRRAIFRKIIPRVMRGWDMGVIHLRECTESSISTQRRRGRMRVSQRKTGDSSAALSLFLCASAFNHGAPTAENGFSVHPLRSKGIAGRPALVARSANTTIAVGDESARNPRITGRAIKPRSGSTKPERCSCSEVRGRIVAATPSSQGAAAPRRRGKMRETKWCVSPCAAKAPQAATRASHPHSHRATAATASFRLRPRPHALLRCYAARTLLRSSVGSSFLVTHGYCCFGATRLIPCTHF